MNKVSETNIDRGFNILLERLILARLRTSFSSNYIVLRLGHHWRDLKALMYIIFGPLTKNLASGRFDPVPMATGTPGVPPSSGGRQCQWIYLFRMPRC